MIITSPGVSAVNQSDNSENSEAKSGTKVAPHLSHFSKPTKESPNSKEHRIESLEEISEKDSVGVRNNSSNAFSDQSKLHDMSETGGSTDFKEIRKKPNLHIFTQNPEAIAAYQSMRKKPDLKSTFYFIQNLSFLTFK